MKLIKTLLTAAFLLCTVVFLGGAEQVFHFQFDKTREQKSLTDLTGKVKCFSTQGIFFVQKGGLRIAVGSSFYIPHNQLPALKEEFSFNLWYYGSSRGLHNPLFSKGLHPASLQFEIYIQNLFPAFFWLNRKSWEGLYTSGYKHLTAYPFKNIIMDKKASEVMPGQWNMLSFVFQKKEVLVYVNGILALRKKPVSKGTLTENTLPLLIGSSRFKGKKFNKADSDMLINDVRLYKGALQADQILALYRREKGRYAKYPSQNSWARLPKYHGYMERLLPGYDPEYSKRLPKTEAYLKNLSKPVFSKKTIVSKLVKDRNTMKMSIDGKLYAPLMYANHINITQVKEFGKRYEDFAAAGFKLIGGGPGSWHDIPHIWKGHGKYDFSLMDKLFRELCRLNPTGKIQVSLHPEPNHWFQRAHEEELELYYATGKSSDELRIYYSGNPGSDIWVNSVSRMLEAMVRHIEKQEYADRVYDYKIFMSGGGEWYWPGCFTGGVSGYSKSTQKTFRRFLKEKYKTDAALQKAWLDPKVTLETACVPSPEFRFASENYNFRDPVKARKCYDFRDYMNDRTVWSVKEITSALKRGCANKKTVTIYYGYPIHYSGSHNPTQFTTGVYTLGRIFRLPSVDHIATPITYARRQIGEAGVVINPFQGSALLHNKLIWHENDLRTHLFPQELFGRPSTCQESRMQIRRGVILASAMGMGCWFLGMPEYVYHEPHIMDEMALQQVVMNKVLKEDTSSVAEVAFIYDEESMRHTGFNRSRFLADHIRELYDDLFHVGAPFDSYLLSDIDNPEMPDYKLYLFVNAFEFTPQKMKKIHAKLARNKAVALWSYAPGLIDGNKLSTESMKKLTTISFGLEKAQRKMVLQINNKAHTLTRNAGKHKTYPVGPIVYVNDPQVQILGTADGKGALAVKKGPKWTNVYTLMPLNREMLASLYKFTGVHTYLKTQDVFFANKSYMMLHTSQGGSKTFYLKRPSDVTEVYTGKNLGRAVMSFTDKDLPFGVSRFYHIKPVKGKIK